MFFYALAVFSLLFILVSCGLVRHVCRLLDSAFEHIERIETKVDSNSNYIENRLLDMSSEVAGLVTVFNKKGDKNGKAKRAAK